MSLRDEYAYANLDSFPRVSGDEPSYGWDGTVLLAFSPRERG